MKLYIVRHGQTESNAGKKLLGITDESINEFGKRQVLEAKNKMKDIKFDICFSSPLKRTIETAKIILDEKVPIITDDRLRERGFGILEGGSSNDKYTYEFWNFYINKSEYEIEPLQDLFTRTKNFIDYLKENYKDENILIASHAATIRALHYNLVGFNKNTNMLSFKVSNAQVFEYDLKS